MLETIITNYLLFIIIAIVLLLGLLGYIMDKRRYERYRQEIINENRARDTIASEPDIQNVVTPVELNKEANTNEQ